MTIHPSRLKSTIHRVIAAATASAILGATLGITPAQADPGLTAPAAQASEVPPAADFRQEVDVSGSAADDDADTPTNPMPAVEETQEAGSSDTMETPGSNGPEQSESLQEPQGTLPGEPATLGSQADGTHPDREVTYDGIPSDHTEVNEISATDSIPPEEPAAPDGTGADETDTPTKLATGPDEVASLQSVSTLSSTVILNPGENGLTTGFSDGNFGYFGTDTSPGRIVKVNLATMRRVRSIPLNSGEGAILSSATDGRFGYFSTSTGAIIEVRLSDMKRYRKYQTRNGNPISVVVSDGTFVYFTSEFQAAFQWPSFYVAKMRISDFTFQGSQLASQVGFPRSAITDGTYVYVGTSSSPGRVVRVRTDMGSRSSALQLNSGENDLMSAVTDGTFGYFGTATSPGQVVKVNLANFSRTSSRPLNNGGNFLTSAVTDGRYGYFGTNTTPGRVVTVDLQAAGAPAQVSTQPLPAGSNLLTSAVRDGNAVYFGSNTNPGLVTKVALRPALTPPGRPGQANVRPRVGALRVAVAPPTSGGAPASYTATASPGGRSCTVSGARGACIIRGLSTQGRYRVTVVARNSQGTSQASVASPSAPQSVTPGAGSKTPRFRDVPARAPYVQASSMMKTRGIIAGSNLRPNRKVSRIALVSMLWRMDGAPAASRDCGFTDLSRIAPANRVAACWAANEGIVAGTSFKPRKAVTRAELATLLWRFAAQPNAKSSCGFRDRVQIPSNARRAACWMKAKKIVPGGRFNPRGQVTRAVVAQQIYRTGGTLNLWLR